MESGSHRFEHTDMRGARFRDVDLTGAAFVDAVMVDVSISGLVGGLTVNTVEVWPLVEAELDRLHPERIVLRPDDADGVRAAVTAIGELWAPTIEFARGLPSGLVDQRVDDEWSFVETLRHLVMCADGWFLHAVLAEPHPYHPLGLAPPFLDDQRAALGLLDDARPSLDEVLALRADRLARLAAYADSVTDARLAAPRPQGEIAYPPPSGHTVLQCLLVVFEEEWWHHQYATRDLAALTQRPTP